MLKRLLLISIVIILGGAVASAVPIEARWTMPASTSQSPELPRLSQPLVLDGELDEWGSAASVPIRVESYISRPKQKGKWQGPADSGMEVYCAWTEEGLCLAAVVADDDVFNDQRGEAFWKRDSIELDFDGRAPEKIGSPTQESGVEHVYYRPPNGTFAAEAYVRPENRGIPGLKSAGKRTPTGYTAELLVPWSAFPAFSPKAGSLFAMQWVLADYDTRDGKDILYPLTLSYLGAKYLRVKPQDYVKWTLVDKLATGPDASLGLMFTLDAPQAVTDNKRLSVTVEATGILTDRTGSVDVKVVDAEGKVILERPVELSPSPKPWDGAKAGRLGCPTDAAADGFGSVEATVRDKQGQVIGSNRRSVLFVRGVVEDLMSKLEKVNLQELARTDPSRAGAYLGAASSLERLDRWVSVSQISEIIPAMREVEARFDLLEDGKLDGQYPGMLDLLTLSGDPDAGVMVQFPPRSTPNVLITWGSFLLASATVSESPTPEIAMKLYESPGGGPEAGWQKTTIGGLPAVVQTRRFARRPSGPSAYDPSRQIMAVYPPDRQASIGPPGFLRDSWNIQAAVVLPGCPAEIREAVEAWAKKSSIALTDMETALTKPGSVVTGDISGTKLADQLKTYLVGSAYEIESFNGLSVIKGKRIISVRAPTRRVAERTAELVAAGQPITPADVDSVRALLVEELAPRVTLDEAPPKGGLYCGDTHLHTTYSDGIASPIELVLEGMYANLDFMVITDHERIDGAQLGARLCARYGLDYPVIVGEEISVDKATIHANAYPLKKVIGPIPPEQAVKEAHGQGAVIQWNHPGWPASDWAFKHLNGGTIGTGFDAWEHYADDLARWKARGIMPVVVGSTDNHSTGFGDWAERTGIIAPSAGGDDLADAIRDRRAALIAPMQNAYLYGPDEMPYWVWQYLIEGKAIKQAKAERLAKALRHADIIGLLKASPPKPQ